MYEILLIIFLMLILATVVVTLALPLLQSLDTWAYRRKVIYWLSAYLMPPLLAASAALGEEPDFRYKYGHSYLTLLEVQNSGLITAALILLAGCWMAPLLLARRTALYLDMLITQVILIAVAIYITAMEVFVYRFSFLAILPAMYALGHILFFQNLCRVQSIIIRPVRVLFAPLALGSIGTTVYLKLCFARYYFNYLPETQPHYDCFVVTAAAQGHPALVSSWYDANEKRRVNRQLVHFYAFEAWLQHHVPDFHHRLRQVYNHIGPRVAGKINTPWKADLAYLSLQPLRWVTALIMKTSTLFT